MLKALSTAFFVRPYREDKHFLLSQTGHDILFLMVHLPPLEKTLYRHSGSVGFCFSSSEGKHAPRQAGKQGKKKPPPENDGGLNAVTGPYMAGVIL